MEVSRNRAKISNVRHELMAANAVESTSNYIPLPQPSQDDPVAGTPPGQIIPPLTVRSMNALQRTCNEGSRCTISRIKYS